MSVVALRNLRESGDDLREELTPVEHAATVLERELPHLINDIAILVGRPFRFIWDPSVGTASTDCLGEIRVDPRPFIEGEREVGYGTVYHETGHILESPYGPELMKRAHAEGGQVLQGLVNVILDRKDDYGTIARAPGFAEVLRKRLLVIGTLARRERYKNLLKNMSLEEQSRFLRHAKPRDAYEDFFMAAKWHKRPRFDTTKRAMKFMSQRRLRTASPEQILWMAKRVREILGKEPKQERSAAEVGFVILWAAFGGVEFNPNRRPDPKILAALQAVVVTYVTANRKNSIAQLVRQVQALGLVYPGPISVGRAEHDVPLRNVPRKADYIPYYQKLLQPLQPMVAKLVQKLRKIDNPSEYELYGRDEGELDLTESARIATGLPGIYLETVVERDIDAEFHLAIDASGSMTGEKLLLAKQIAIVFSEAIRSLAPKCVGRIWSFNSEAVRFYGAVGPGTGFVLAKCTGGNSDTDMLKYIGRQLARSRRRRKVLLVLCDDGPDDMKLVGELSQQLVARGILVVHLLVGVHATPDIYPVELVYTSMEECLNEFGDLIETIISHLR